jgi:hypothetical protein
MAIQVSGVNVIDNERNLNVGVLTATSVDVPPTVLNFSPNDGATDVSLTNNISILFNSNVTKGSGNITLREGSASGTVIETIAVSSGSVSLSAAQVTINPSDFPSGKDIYVVIDEGAFVQSNTELGGSSPLLNTYNFTTGPITVSSFSPSDGATDQSISTNIVITFSENITKETNASQKYIRIRSGNPSSGTLQQSIDVSTSAVSVSGNQATINPPSDLAYETDTYIVVEENSFFNSDGDADSGNAEINTYNFTTESDVPPLGGGPFEGGYLICCSSNTYWIVAPSSTEVSRDWYNRNDAITTANSNSSCGDWFVPTCGQLKNPGRTCKTHWDSYQNSYYWSNTEESSVGGYFVDFSTSDADAMPKPSNRYVRAFRTVSY